MKRLMACFLAALLVMTGALRGHARTDEVSRAWRAAAIYVPGSAMPEGMEERGDVLAFYFIDEQKQYSFEVLIGRENTAFLQRTQVAYARTAGQQVALTMEDIKTRVKDGYTDAIIDALFARQEAGLYSYQVVFTQEQAGRLHRSVFNAQDGELLVDVMWPAGPAEGFLTFGQIREMALGQLLEEGMLTDIRMEWADGVTLYLVSIFLNGEEQVIRVNAQTGEILDDAAIQKTPPPQATDVPPKPTATPPATAVPPKPTATQVPSPTSAPILTLAPTKTPAPAPTPDDDDDDDWDDWDDDDWDDDDDDD